MLKTTLSYENALKTASLEVLPNPVGSPTLYLKNVTGAVIGGCMLSLEHFELLQSVLCDPAVVGLFEELRNKNL